MVYLTLNASTIDYNNYYSLSIYQLDPKEREADAIMEGYVLEQDGKKLNRCWYMLGKDLALYKFRAHEVSHAVRSTCIMYMYTI